YWKATSVPALDPSHSSTTVIVEVPKDIFNNFNRYLVEELADVQKVFYQMEQSVEQHRLESRTFEVKMNQVLSENEQLLEQAIDKDIVKNVVNLSSGETVTECQKLDTPMVEKSKLDEDKEGKAVDPSHYRGSAYRKAPKCSKNDLSVPKRNRSSGPLVSKRNRSSDHAGCQDTRRSTSGSIQLLGDRLVSWSSKRQKSAAISSTEAEYIAVTSENFRI
ncbi:copia protein, partial [Tanacetum coccineum]